MRKILIVHAHPERQSFCAALKDTAVDHFRSRGDEVRISDLYAMKFDPVGDHRDFKHIENPDYFKYQLEQVEAWKNDQFIDEVKVEMDKFEWCDIMIFNFPLWWFGLPAILKGWVDRVFAMGFVYGAGKGVYDNGYYTNKKAFLTFTTGGPEVAYGPSGKNGELDTILFPIHHGMLYFAGMTVLPPFISFSPVRLSDDERKAELHRYRSHLEQLDEQLPLYTVSKTS